MARKSFADQRLSANFAPKIDLLAFLLDEVSQPDTMLNQAQGGGT
jgi:hypothetical protein